MMAGEAEATVLGTEKNTNADLVADKMSALKLKESTSPTTTTTTTTNTEKTNREEEDEVDGHEHDHHDEVETGGDGGGAAEADDSDDKTATTSSSAAAAAASAAATSQDALSTALEFSGGEGSLTIKVQSEDVGRYTKERVCACVLYVLFVCLFIHFLFIRFYSSRVIGKWGQTIRELQERTGASISLPKGYTKEEFKLVTISGTREQVCLIHNYYHLVIIIFFFLVIIHLLLRSQIAHCNALLQLRIAPREDHERIRALQAEARKYEVNSF